MKKTFSVAAVFAAALLWSCGGGGDHDSTSDTAGMETTPTTTMPDTTSMAPPPPTYDATPLEKADKDFVVKAASGGIMEVELGNIAQQNAASQRVKDFAAMLVRDHSKANDELNALASAKGTMINKDSLLNLHKGHIESLQKKTGAEFDKAYMKMMVSDHQEDVSKFQNKANNGKDSALKTWAAATVPTLRMHLDSAKAINSSLK
ncbi:DUF4142 domain-containing protein [Paraflavisolibacter sp. H34]|uniref:DUF4142 domain-containing protein n=1 Tax=Huijunlia imazamoxiresistens TaxID=3127457 RepID=UPI003016F879